MTFLADRIKINSLMAKIFPIEIKPARPYPVVSGRIASAPGWPPARLKAGPNDARLKTGEPVMAIGLAIEAMELIASLDRLDMAGAFEGRLGRDPSLRRPWESARRRSSSGCVMVHVASW